VTDKQTAEINQKQGFIGNSEESEYTSQNFSPFSFPYNFSEFNQKSGSYTLSFVFIRFLGSLKFFIKN
jgi:hypothetical protein